PAGPAIPHDRGLALIGDADCGDVTRCEARAMYRLLQHGAGALPDLDGIMLDPPGARQDLLVLELVPRPLATPMIEDHRAGTGGALVDRRDEVSHAQHAPGRPVPHRRASGGPPAATSAGRWGERWGRSSRRGCAPACARTTGSATR